jgi:hypothetical protein
MNRRLLGYPLSRPRDVLAHDPVVRPANAARVGREVASAELCEVAADSHLI